MLHAPQWKYRELVAALGADIAVIEILRADGFNPPPAKTIAGWRMRNSIPGPWVPALIQAAMRRGLLEGIDQLRRVA